MFVNRLMIVQNVDVFKELRNLHLPEILYNNNNSNNNLIYFNPI